MGAKRAVGGYWGGSCEVAVSEPACMYCLSEIVEIQMLDGGSLESDTWRVGLKW